MRLVLLTCLLLKHSNASATISGGSYSTPPAWGTSSALPVIDWWKLKLKTQPKTIYVGEIRFPFVAYLSCSKEQKHSQELQPNARCLCSLRLPWQKLVAILPMLEEKKRVGATYISVQSYKPKIMVGANSISRMTHLTRNTNFVNHFTKWFLCSVGDSDRPTNRNTRTWTYLYRFSFLQMKEPFLIGERNGKDGSLVNCIGKENHLVFILPVRVKLEAMETTKWEWAVRMQATNFYLPWTLFER